MIDYDGLRALDSIIRHQSFSRAAKELRVTQSAVSQRLSQLEGNVGEPLLVREQPYRPTASGERMLGLLRQVTLIEQGFAAETAGLARTPLIRLSVNLDSLELWFASVLKDKEIAGKINLAITTDDEKFTLRHLIAGKVDLAVSATKSAIQNYESHYLGSMAYSMVSTPAFKAHHFPKGISKSRDLSAIAAVIFDEKDDLHARFLQGQIGYEGDFPFSAIPTVHGYKTAIQSGFGYGVLPRALIEKELKSGTLVALHPEKIVRDLYLHHWTYLSHPMKLLVKSISNAAKSLQ